MLTSFILGKVKATKSSDYANLVVVGWNRTRLSLLELFIDVSLTSQTTKKKNHYQRLIKKKLETSQKKLP